MPVAVYQEHFLQLQLPFLALLTQQAVSNPLHNRHSNPVFSFIQEYMNMEAVAEQLLALSEQLAGDDGSHGSGLLPNIRQIATAGGPYASTAVSGCYMLVLSCVLNV